MNEAVFMLNALWFKPKVGHQRYREYADAMQPLLEKAGAEVQPSYTIEASLIGDWDPDVFFIVKYPNQESFDSMIASPEFKAIKHLRENAIDKSLLLSCKQLG